MSGRNVVEEVADKLEIADVLQRYAEAIDGKELERLRDVFAPDAEIDYNVPGGAKLTLDDAVPWLGQALQMFEVTQHLLSHPSVELQGDRARSRTYLAAAHVQRKRDGARVYVLQHAVYLDRWVRTPRGWRIAWRRLDNVYIHGAFADRADVELFPEAPASAVW